MADDDADAHVIAPEDSASQTGRDDASRVSSVARAQAKA